MITCKLIKKLVERESGIPDLSKKTRKRKLTNYRFVYFALCRKFVPKSSLRKIGLTVGLKNHATVINGIKKVEDLKDTKYFKTYYKCFLNLTFGLENYDEDLEFKTIDEVKNHHRVKHIVTMTKAHKVIKNLQNRIVEINKYNKDKA